MIRLFQFEISKILKSKFFRILSFILFLCLIAYYVFVHINTVRVEEVVRDLENTIKMTEQQLQSMDDEDDILKNLLEKDKFELHAYETEDWNAVLNAENERSIPLDMETLLSKREYYTSSFPTLFTHETRREQYRWMQEKNIVPVLRVDIFTWRTVYDVFYPANGAGDDEILKSIVHSRSDKYSSSGVYYLHHVVNVLFGLFGVLFFLILFGDVVTKEGLGRNGSIHLLRTQPLQKDKILVSKFITTLLITFLLLVGIAGVSLLLGTIFDRFGDWKYPVLIYGEDYAFEFVNMSTFLAKSALLFFMVLLFSYSLLFLFSVLTKRVIIALGLTIVTILLGMQMGEQAILSSLASYVPFHYFAVPKIVTMEFAASLKNFDFTYNKGLMILGAYSLIILLITYVLSVFQHKRN